MQSQQNAVGGRVSAPRSARVTSGLAILGSLLMFVGWALAIVSTFQHAHRVIIPLILGIVGFGIVLIPTGLDLVRARQAEPAEKSGLSVVAISMLPAIALFLIVLLAFPLSPPIRIAAAVTEVIGMALYAWTFRAVSTG